MKLKELLLLEKYNIKSLKKNRTPLTPEEKKEVMDRKAVWHSHFGRDGKKEATPAVWKSKAKDGSFVYICATHRAGTVEKSLKAAINKFHSFIKGTS